MGAGRNNVCIITRLHSQSHCFHWLGNAVLYISANRSTWQTLQGKIEREFQGCYWILTRPTIPAPLAFRTVTDSQSTFLKICLVCVKMNTVADYFLKQKKEVESSLTFCPLLSRLLWKTWCHPVTLFSHRKKGWPVGQHPFTIEQYRATAWIELWWNIKLMLACKQWRQMWARRNVVSLYQNQTSPH